MFRYQKPVTIIATRSCRYWSARSKPKRWGWILPATASSDRTATCSDRSRRPLTVADVLSSISCLMSSDRPLLDVPSPELRLRLSPRRVAFLFLDLYPQKLCGRDSSSQMSQHQNAQASLSSKRNEKWFIRAKSINQDVG